VVIFAALQRFPKQQAAFGHLKEELQIPHFGVVDVPTESLGKLSRFKK